MKNKDWTGNRNSIFKTLGASNHTDEERETDDFYATDPKAIDLLHEYENLQLPYQIWEPSCGSGCLSERLKEYGHQVVSTDLVNRGYGAGDVNFFEQTKMPANCEAIITNPPYKHATEYVIHALRLLPENGLLCLFLKTTFAEGKERYAKIFGITPPYTFCSVQNEYYVPKTQTSTIWKSTVAAPLVMRGGYGERAIKEKQHSTGLTTHP